MKIRTSHVTNSSSASYIVLKKGLTEAQIELILDPSSLKNKFPFMFEFEDQRSWTIKDSKEEIALDTFMDNFSYRELFDVLGIPDKNIKVIDEPD